MSNKKAIAAAGFAAALGVPAAVQATPNEGTTAESQSAVQTVELIECSITGKTIPACCCPVIDDDD
jgi:hypothetical protein